MTTYRVAKAPDGWPESLRGEFRVSPMGHDRDYGIGETFDHEFTVEEEAANLASGLLEIVPSEWKVVGGSRVFDTDPGETFMAGIPLGQQELLIAGGHIEPVEQPAPADPPAAKKHTRTKTTKQEES